MHSRIGIVLFVALICSASSFAQKRLALIIGNNRYIAQDSLRNPVNDARLLNRKLKECGFETFVYENVTRKKLTEAVNKFYDRINADKSVALFYYSGHGIQSEGENFLIPVDAVIKSKTDIETECFPLGRVLGKMDDSKSTTNIIILDACRRDPYSKGWYRGEGDKGLTEIRRKPRQSFIAFATAPYEIANDGSKGNSPFCEAIAKNIDRPGMEIYDVFRKVGVEVSKQYPNQKPWFNSSLYDDFYFKPTKGDSANATASIKSNRISFAASADCNLMIEGVDSISLYEGKSFTLSFDPAKAPYKVRAVSMEDPLISWDTAINAFDTDETQFMMIPLQGKINRIKYSDIAGGRKGGSEQPSESEENRALRLLLDQISNNMVLIDSGTYEMGTRSGNNDESPAHKVDVGSFYLSKHEVTNNQWSAITGKPLAKDACANCPVESVSWQEAEAFITKLNEYTKAHYRLPTEAEWEYAARGGKLKFNQKFSGTSKLDKYGWFYDNSSGHAHPVGRLGGNELGLFDMSGNVAEWCGDFYSGDYYRESANKNPKGPDSGKSKVFRGGSWNDNENACRVFSRGKGEVNSKAAGVGFRLAKHAE